MRKRMAVAAVGLTWLGLRVMACGYDYDALKGTAARARRSRASFRHRRHRRRGWLPAPTGRALAVRRRRGWRGGFEAHAGRYRRNRRQATGGQAVERRRVRRRGRRRTPAEPPARPEAPPEAAEPAARSHRFTPATRLTRPRAPRSTDASGNGRAGAIEGAATFGTGIVRNDIELDGTAGSLRQIARWTGRDAAGHDDCLLGAAARERELQHRVAARLRLRCQHDQLHVLHELFDELLGRQGCALRHHGQRQLQRTEA